MNIPLFLNPAVKPSKHTLYEIDREREIAFCTVCGWTEIHIPKTTTNKTPKIMCVRRYQETNEGYKKWVEKNRPSQSVRQERHLLSEIDIEKMSATCVICGRVEIKKQTIKNIDRYYCATNLRAKARKRRRANYIARPTNPHALSQIDEEKKTAVCAKCGPVEIEIRVGKKKITRGCVNARSDLKRARETRRPAKKDETI